MCKERVPEHEQTSKGCQSNPSQTNANLTLRKQIIIIIGAHTYIVDAINKGIVAAIAHGQPIAAKPDDANEVVVVDFRYRDIQNIIELQWQPAESKDNDHDNQHFDDLQASQKKEIKPSPDLHTTSTCKTHLLLVFQQRYVP